MELKSCPFCGSANTEYYMRFVGCKDCGSSGPELIGADRKAALTGYDDLQRALASKWNMRSAASASSEQKP